MKRTRQRGFSMIEMMIVIVIILLVSAMAMPSMTRTIATIRLRGGISSVAGMIQKTRIEAVRGNRIMVLREQTLNDGFTPAFYVDGSADPSKKIQDPKTQNNSLDSWEAQVVINSDIKLEAASSAPAFPMKDLLGYENPVSDLPFEIAFNQRGLPCTITASSSGQITSCGLKNLSKSTTSESSYQYFFRYKSTFGDQWASLTVTPAGRVRVWTWNGKDWS